MKTWKHLAIVVLSCLICACSITAATAETPTEPTHMADLAPTHLQIDAPDPALRLWFDEIPGIEALWLVHDPDTPPYVRLWPRNPAGDFRER